MKLRIFFWLVILALLWGPAFLFVKVAVQEVPPLTLVAARVSLAAVLLFVLLRVQRQKLPRLSAQWGHFGVAGLASNALPFVLLSWGQQYVDSALAAIIIGTTPLFTILLAHQFTADDRLTSIKSIGVLLGFGGLVLLLAPTLLEGAKVTSWGLAAAAGAALSYAVGIIYTRQKLRGLPSLVGPTAQLMMAAMVLIPLSIILENPASIPLPSWSAAGSLLALAVVSTALAFVIFYRVMEKANATNLSMITYMVPLVATILGVVLLKEQLGWNAYLGFGLIILGVMAVNGVFKSAPWHRLASTHLRRRRVLYNSRRL